MESPFTKPHPGIRVLIGSLQLGTKDLEVTQWHHVLPYTGTRTWRSKDLVVTVYLGACTVNIIFRVSAFIPTTPCDSCYKRSIPSVPRRNHPSQLLNPVQKLCRTKVGPRAEIRRDCSQMPFEVTISLLPRSPLHPHPTCDYITLSLHPPATCACLSLQAWMWIVTPYKELELSLAGAPGLTCKLLPSYLCFLPGSSTTYSLTDVGHEMEVCHSALWENELGTPSENKGGDCEIGSIMDGRVPVKRRVSQRSPRM